ncbi:hypothetical protein ACEQPO_29390 [Bacillus sp. SL00103]
MKNEIIAGSKQLATIRDRNGVPLRVAGALFDIHGSEIERRRTTSIRDERRLDQRACGSLWDIS